MNVEVELANVNTGATTLKDHTAVLVERATDCYLMASVEMSMSTQPTREVVHIHVSIQLDLLHAIVPQGMD
jgi:hypothetical protein